MDNDRSNDFKELCRAAAHEMDSDKLMVLVAEIIDAYDEGERKRNSAPEREKTADPPSRVYSSRCGPKPAASSSIRYWS